MHRLSDVTCNVSARCCAKVRQQGVLWLRHSDACSNAGPSRLSADSWNQRAGDPYRSSKSALTCVLSRSARKRPFLLQGRLSSLAVVCRSILHHSSFVSFLTFPRRPSHSNTCCESLYSSSRPGQLRRNGAAHCPHLLCLLCAAVDHHYCSPLSASPPLCFTHLKGETPMISTILTPESRVASSLTPADEPVEQQSPPACAAERAPIAGAGDSSSSRDETSAGLTPAVVADRALTDEAPLPRGQNEAGNRSRRPSRRVSSKRGMKTPCLSPSSSLDACRENLTLAARRCQGAWENYAHACSRYTGAEADYITALMAVVMFRATHDVLAPDVQSMHSSGWCHIVTWADARMLDVCTMLRLRTRRARPSRPAHPTHSASEPRLGKLLSRRLLRGVCWRCLDLVLIAQWHELVALDQQAVHARHALALATQLKRETQLRAKYAAEALAVDRQLEPSHDIS